jgi:penicillin-binding protein 2
MISNSVPKGTVLSLDELPPLSTSERRWFGIGQGKLQAIPLQVANAMAAIARAGYYKNPQLFLDDPNDPEVRLRADANQVNLGISAETLAVVYDGMSAVVNEAGGTANTQFQPVLGSFAEQDVKIYGKTGSTQPANAWFAGFAADSKERKIAIAVVVEGGQHGSSDAAPLACDIIQFAIEAGYLGKPTTAEEI